jgi:hypothetical protein
LRTWIESELYAFFALIFLGIPTKKKGPLATPIEVYVIYPFGGRKSNVVVMRKRLQNNDLYRVGEVGGAGVEQGFDVGPQSLA